MLARINTMSVVNMFWTKLSLLLVRFQLFFQTETYWFLLGTNTKPNQVLAASVINALVMEFSGTGKSSMIGLSLAGHAEAKLYFETNELPGIFSLGLVLTQTNQLPREE